MNDLLECRTGYEVASEAGQIVLHAPSEATEHGLLVLAIDDDVLAKSNFGGKSLLGVLELE
jgi:hypothetical protein